MSVVNINKLDKNQVELEFLIPKVTFDEAVASVFKKKASKMNVPGFRKGKAPRNIIEKMYGKGVFYEDALNEIIPSEFDGSLHESGIEAVSRPEFDMSSIDENGVLMKAKFYVKPEVQISDYIGIEADKVVTPATDADVEAELGRTRERNSRLIDIIDRPAQNGDTTVIDYDGYVEGAAFEGGKSEKYNLVLGSNSFIPGFETQIIGHSIGDEFDVNVTFPTDYNKKELADKEAVFKVSLKEIKLKELPELDDEFAKDVSDFDTLDEYKADILAKINERNDKAADNAVEGKLIDALLSKLDADIPSPMIDAEVENIIRDRDYSMRSQGLNLDMYMKYTGMTLDTMREQAKPQAERQIKTRLALEKIAINENIEADEADIEAEYDKLVKMYNMEIDKVKEAVMPDALKKDICIRKAVDFVKNNAFITVKQADETTTEIEEAPSEIIN
jgi:trigger factor